MHRISIQGTRAAAPEGDAARSNGPGSNYLDEIGSSALSCRATETAPECIDQLVGYKNKSGSDGGNGAPTRPSTTICHETAEGTEESVTRETSASVFSLKLTVSWVSSAFLSERQVQTACGTTTLQAHRRQSTQSGSTELANPDVQSH